jgi:hypothetical protein
VTQRATIDVIKHDGIKSSISGCEKRAKTVVPTPIPASFTVSFSDLYGRNKERQCFAGAGARLHEAVPSLQNLRDRLGLNLGHVPAIRSGQAAGKSKGQIKSRMICI